MTSTETQPKLVGIRTATLRSNVVLGFDLFLMISGKHILYIKRDDNIEDSRLDNLKKKQVREVFIYHGDLKAYEEFLNSSAKTALTDLKMPVSMKASIIGGQAKAAVEDIFSDPEKKENFQRTQVAAANQVALLLKNPEALEQMLKIAAYDKTTYQHSVNVATISIGLALSMGANAQICNTLGVGGLLHDIGKSKSPTTDEATLRQHPRVGAGLLQGKSYVSKDILDVILLHEERLDGKGYPSGVKKLDQIFQVIGLANLYDRMVTLEGRVPKDAYDEISKMDPAPYDPDLIEGLKEVLVTHKIY